LKCINCKYSERVAVKEVAEHELNMHAYICQKTNTIVDPYIKRECEEGESWI